jgi:hypothetical protein
MWLTSRPSRLAPGEEYQYQLKRRLGNVSLEKNVISVSVIILQTATKRGGREKQMF